MSAENVNSESESDVGQPTISHASTEAINDSSSESGALVEEDSSPSVIKLVLIIVVFFGLLGATGFGGWKAYLAYIENSKAVDVSSLDQAEFGAVSTNLSGVNKDTTVEIATPDTTLPEPNFTVEVDYQVNPVGGPNNSEFSENSNTEDKPSNRGITQEQYENLLSKLEAYDSRIDKVLNNQSLLTQQINRSVSGITDSVGDSNGLLLLVRSDLEGVITGQEVLSQRLKSQTRTVKKIESTTVAEIAAKEALKEKPRFRVTEHSEWGDSVTLMIENEDGFYQSAGVGTEINGWVLRTVNLKKRASLWAGGKGNYELTW